MIYSIEVGRWTGPFAFTWYADVFTDQDRQRIATFNSLTKKGARNKAARYVRRLHKSMPRDLTVYAYDVTKDELTQMGDL